MGVYIIFSKTRVIAFIFKGSDSCKSGHIAVAELCDRIAVTTIGVMLHLFSSPELKAHG